MAEENNLDDIDDVDIESVIALIERGEDNDTIITELN